MATKPCLTNDFYNYRHNLRKYVDKLILLLYNIFIKSNICSHKRSKKMKTVSLTVPELDKKLREMYNYRLAETNNETLKKVRHALVETIKNDLTERQKETVILYYYKKMTMAEIADILGVNVSTVSRTLARARKNICDRTKYYFY